MDFNEIEDKNRLIEVLLDDKYWRGYPITSHVLNSAAEKLQKHPLYDADVEQALIARIGQHTGSVKRALQPYHALRDLESPIHMKYTPEMTERPFQFGMAEIPEENPRTTKKKSLGTRIFGGLLGD